MRNKVGNPRKRTQRRNARRAVHLFWRWPGRRVALRHCDLMGGHTWQYEDHDFLRRLGVERRTCPYCRTSEMGNRKFVKGRWTWKPKPTP